MTDGRIIAFGDIHGCARALTAVLDAIAPTPLDTLVFLGDYIDRGPDSRGVIDCILAVRERCAVVALQGNHEEMLLRALDDEAALRFWLTYGGVAALASYGFTGGRGIQSAGLRAWIPAEHLAFVRGCGDVFETPTHFFTHGYYEPHLPLAAQPWAALRWTFIPPVPERHCSGKTAVVGHTPQRGGDMLDLNFLKGIDTNCHAGGWLTAWEAETSRVWQVDHDGRLRG